MVRALAGSAFLLSAVSAAALVGPSLAPGSRGEPMVVRGGVPAGLQPARFEQAPCPSNLLLSEGGLAEGLTAVEIRFWGGDAGSRAGEAVQADSLVVILDASGRVLAAGPPESLAAVFGTGAPDGCADLETGQLGLI